MRIVILGKLAQELLALKEGFVLRLLSAAGRIARGDESVMVTLFYERNGVWAFILE